METEFDQISYGKEVDSLGEEKVFSNSFIKGGWYE